MKNLLFQELKQSLNKRLVTFLVFLNLFPYLLFWIQKDSYAFIDELDTFSFIFDGVMILFFIFFVLFIYLGDFVSTLNNRFIVYQRTRTSLENILSTAMLTNIILTFTVFFILVLHVFLFFFYIQPKLGLVQFYPEIQHLNTPQELLEFNIHRYTFTQLLIYNPIVFGIIYSLWVGVMASIYATIGFFSVLIFKNKLIGLSVPILFYIIGTYLFNLFGFLEAFGMANVVFPFNSSQHPISMMLLNLAFYALVILSLYIYIFKIKILKLDDTV